MWRKLMVGFFLLLAAYFATRLYNLTSFPIFTDEAIYIRWSQIGSRDANWRFISLTDGKQPLFTWAMMAVLKVVDDPLFAGRLVSVLAGAGSLIGIWLLTHEVFEKKNIAFLASILYLVLPFSVVYDRMALYDSLVATFSIWNLYLAMLLVRHLRLDTALILGLTLGAGMLNKTSGFLSLYLLPVTLILFDWKAKDRLVRLAKWIGLAILAAALSQALYSVLRLSPLFHMVTQKDALFVFSFKEWLEQPFRYFEGNLRGMFDWLWNYLTLPVFLLALAPLLFRSSREKLLLYAWWLLPFLALANFGRVLYPRFILFMSMPLLVLAAGTLSWINKKVAALLLLPAVVISLLVVINPLVAPIPYNDKGQYFNDWPAGWGVKEVNEFILAQSKKGKVSVYTEGTFGLLPYAIEIYLVDLPNISIAGIWPLPNELPDEVIEVAKDHPTYFVLNQSQEVPSNWQVELVAEYQKGTRQNRKLRLFRILPV